MLDDTVVGFQNSGDAKRFHDDLKERLKQFALDLHPEKTRLVAFGRFVRCPGTFDFLGFTHISGKKRNGKGFQLWRKTSCKRKWAFIRRIAEELRQHKHVPIDEQGRWLASVLKGHYAYFAVPTNIAAVRAVRHHIKIRWYLTLLRRSQRHRLKCARMDARQETTNCHAGNPSCVSWHADTSFAGLRVAGHEASAWAQ